MYYNYFIIYLPIIIINAGTGSRSFFRQCSKWSFPSPPLTIIYILTKSRGILHIKKIITIPIKIKKDFFNMQTGQI